MNRCVFLLSVLVCTSAIAADIELRLNVAGDEHLQYLVSSTNAELRLSRTATGWGTIDYELPAQVIYRFDLPTGQKVLDAKLSVDGNWENYSTIPESFVAFDVSTDGNTWQYVNQAVWGVPFPYNPFPSITAFVAGSESIFVRGRFGGQYQLFMRALSRGHGLALDVNTFLPGDYNDDNTVDAVDYSVWRNAVGQIESLPNDDTAGVGQDDYDRWKLHFGATAIESGTGTNLSSVPESIFSPLVVAAAVRLLLRSRPRRAKYKQA